jgi:hypothetical protein
MARDESRTTLADYVALAICPALIIGLVASLVFFLVEVLYVGEFAQRLRWILFFFVVGAVLIARISMTGGISDRAGMYGLVLGVLVFIGMQAYVKYPEDSAAGQLSWLINLGLIAVVWWSAHRLTADCTQVDDDADVTGQGILQAAGLDESAADTQPDAEKEQPGGWWQRFQRYREKQRKKRTLGVWIVWFSLAAFPIFGLGQSLIPAHAAARRQFSFWLMTVYLACGLGLLLATCFLGLRRYLAQRRAQMPAAVTTAWLLAGGGFAVVLLAIGAFLPRPEMEYSLFDFGGTKSPEREASRLAMKGDSPTKGDGSGGNQGKEGEKDGDAQGKGDSNEQGKEPGNQGKDGNGKDGSEKGKDGGEQGEQKGSNNDNAEKQGSDQQQGKDKNQGDGKKQGGGQKGKSNSSSSSSTSSGSWGDFFKPVAGVMKWIVFALIAIVAVVVVLRGVLRFFANFTGWARGLLDFFNRLWESLFGARPAAKEQPAAEAPEAAEPEYHAPFSAFPNPFGGALGGSMSRKDLIRYTFAAMQAWARERGIPRQPSETPLEFVNRLSDEVPPLEDAARQLVMLYGRAVYARGGLPENSTETIREIWDRLEAVAEQPLSA